MKHKFANALSLALIVAMLFTSLALASGVDVSVVDVNVPLDAVTLAPGASGNITINLSVTGNQAGTATFEVNRDWTLSGGTFTGSNPQEFTVPPRAAGDPATTFSTNGTVTVAAGQAPGGPFTVTIGVFDITNTNDTGAKLSAGHSDTYRVTVSAPIKTTPTINWTNPADIVYGTVLSGTELNATASVPGTFTYTPAAGTVLNAGNGQTLHVDFVPTDTTLYNNASKDVTINVLKADPGCNITGYSGTYDGNAHGASGSCTAQGTLSLGASFTDVAGGTANWSFTASSSNYNNANGTVAIVIAKADAGCSIAGYTGTYDGNAHGASGSCSGQGTLDLGASFTDVSGGTATWSFTGDSNHNDASGSVGIVITQATSIVTITCPASVIYNATSQMPCSAKASGAGMNDVPLTVSYSNNTNAGTATASASWSGDINHSGNSATKDFTIEQADATCIVSGYSGVYDTAFHVATGSCSGIGGENAGTLDLGGSFKDVPGGNADWSFTGNNNYKNQSGTVAIVITKADATCSISGYTGVFDGASHGATGSCSGIGGENAGSLNLGTTFTYPPGGNAAWSFTGNGNYRDQSGSVAINIAAWTLNGFYQPVDMGGVYNTVRGGSTVPLKFELFAGSTELTNTSAILSLNAVRVTCSSGASEDAIEITATGSTSLRYDTTGGQFIYNWKTPTGANTCYKVTMTAVDGSALVAFFKLK